MIEISDMQEKAHSERNDRVHTLSLFCLERSIFKILSNDLFIDQVMFYSRIFVILFCCLCKKVSFHKTRDRVFF